MAFIIILHMFILRAKFKIFSRIFQKTYNPLKVYLDDLLFTTLITQNIHIFHDLIKQVAEMKNKGKNINSKIGFEIKSQRRKKQLQIQKFNSNFNVRKQIFILQNVQILQKKIYQESIIIWFQKIKDYFSHQFHIQFKSIAKKLQIMFYLSKQIDKLFNIKIFAKTQNYDNEIIFIQGISLVHFFIDFVRLYKFQPPQTMKLFQIIFICLIVFYQILFDFLQSIFIDPIKMFENEFQFQQQINLNEIAQRSHFYDNISTPQSQRKYIEQFFQQGVLEAQNLFLINTQSSSQIVHKSDQETLPMSPKYSSRHKSKFHNYQKHLIITLRKTIRFQKFQLGNSTDAVRQLWKCFCVSKIYNKSLLRILFGQHMMEEQLNQILFKKEGFKLIIEKYTVDQIIEAQNILRRTVLNHFEKNSLDFLLNSRKLPQQTKELFKKYIMQFIMELKEGNVMKRLPKSRKRQILTNN